MKDERRLYGDLAWIWPIISTSEEYVDETEQFCELVRRHSLIQPKTLLNLGCGGGRNDFTLKKHFQVTGVDISERMLETAKRVNPEINYLVGDMRNLELGKTFDAVVIFDSIGYMLTEEELQAAFKTAFLHLKPGGVFITYQENDPQTFKQNYVQHLSASEGDIEIVFIENYYDPDLTDTTHEATFIYLIRRRGQLQVEVDHHLSGVFPRQTWLALLQKTGFEVKEVLEVPPPEAYTTFVCVKPS